LLEIQDLQLVYPNGYEALKSVSLRVGRGEIVAVVGRSGAGKSTLLRCINGLERPTAGSVALDGQDISRLSGKDLRLL
jgi:ABC-type methionine transport system ATPase subunit